MNKKYMKTVKNKEYYKFKKLLDKDGDHIFNAVCDELGEYSKDAERLYDLTVMKVWEDISKKGTMEKNFIDYISEVIGELSIEDNSDYRLHIAMDDIFSKRILKIRERVYRNQRVIGKIIIRELKKELGIENTIYESLINTYNVSSRSRDVYGNFVKGHSFSSNCYFYAVVITNHSIYFKPLTRKYEVVNDEENYISSEFNDIEYVEIVKSEMENLPGPLIIKLKNGKKIELKYIRSMDVIKLKKFLKHLFIEKGIYGVAS